MKERLEIEELREQGYGYHDIALMLNITTDAVRNYFYRKHKSVGVSVQNVSEELTPEEEITILQSKLQSMNRKLKVEMVDRNLDLAFARAITVPKYDMSFKGNVEDGVERGIVLFSDLHYGLEFKTQLNIYNPKVAEERLLYYVDRINHIFSKYYPHIKSLTMLCLGDNIEGNNIYRGQEYESIPITDQIAFAPSLIANAFSKIIYPFEIWTIDGNHGRMEAGVMKHNWDRTVYYLLQRMLPEVKFHIGTDFYQMVDIYNYKFLIMHGEDITNGKRPPSFIERAVSEYTGVFRKQNVYFDYMVMGHFHEAYSLPSAIVNGSLCGATTFTQKKIKDAGLPVQVCFIVNQKRGIVDYRTIVLEEK